jgi:hypothetical protein
MPSSLLDLLISRYLRNPRTPVQQEEYRGLLHDAIPPLVDTTQSKLLQTLPNIISVSFVRLAQSIGIWGRGKSKTDTITWAKTITALLSKIDPIDQNSTMIRYSRIPSQIVTPSKILPGCMYTYKYEAGTTEDYDIYPMMLCLSRTQTSMLGMNFHYLPYAYRFLLFEAMMPLIAPIPVTQLSRIYITYKRLLASRKFRGYGSTIKRYNISQFQTNAVFITPIEWGVALAYPSSEFEGKDVNRVYQESLQNHYYYGT